MARNVNFEYNTRHHKTLMSFIDYCQEHPEERFWQALRNWSGQMFIFASDTGPHDPLTFSVSDLKDTFYWEGKNQ